MVRSALPFACLYLLIQNMAHVYAHIPGALIHNLSSSGLNRSVELVHMSQIPGVASDIPDLPN